MYLMGESMVRKRWYGFPKVSAGEAKWYFRLSRFLKQKFEN